MTDTEYGQLKFGLNHSYINKYKIVKKDITIHLESLAYTASEKVKNIQLENFHEFLRSYTDIFSKNVLNSEDFTYKNIKSLIQDQNIVILKGNKDSQAFTNCMHCYDHSRNVHANGITHAQKYVHVFDSSI